MPNITTTPPKAATLRKRAERERRRAANQVNKNVTLSPSNQTILDEVMSYTGRRNFSALMVDLLLAYHGKVTEHKRDHACCGKCGDPYQLNGHCLFKGDSACQYSVSSDSQRALKP